VEEMSSIVSERLSRLRLDLRGIARLLRSPALRAGRRTFDRRRNHCGPSDGWLQPFERLTYDALRVAWLRAPGYFWSAGPRMTSPILIGL
jgi:hypothetical protein